jgi:hypothetical protein
VVLRCVFACVRFVLLNIRERPRVRGDHDYGLTNECHIRTTFVSRNRMPIQAPTNVQRMDTCSVDFNIVLQTAYKVFPVRRSGALWPTKVRKGAESSTQSGTQARKNYFLNVSAGRSSSSSVGMKMRWWSAQQYMTWVVFRGGRICLHEGNGSRPLGKTLNACFASSRKVSQMCARLHTRTNIRANLRIHIVN